MRGVRDADFLFCQEILMRTEHPYFAILAREVLVRYTYDWWVRGGRSNVDGIWSLYSHPLIENEIVRSIATAVKRLT